MIPKFSVVHRPVADLNVVGEPIISASKEFQSHSLQNHDLIQSFVPISQNFEIANEVFESQDIYQSYKPYIGEENDIIEENTLENWENELKYLTPKRNLLFDISSFTEKYRYLQNVPPSESNFFFPETSDQPFQETNCELHFIEPLLKNQEPRDQISIQTKPKSIELNQANFSYKPYLSSFHDNTNLISEIPLNDISGVDSCTFINNEPLLSFENGNSNQTITSNRNFVSSSMFDSTFQSMKVPILTFNIHPKTCYEPFTIEWLQDLQISENEFANFIENKPLLQQTLDLPNAYSKLKHFPPIVKVHELYLPIKLKPTLQFEDFLNHHKLEKCHNFDDKPFPVESIPPIIQINTVFFEKNDIEQFSQLFPSLKILPIKLDYPILFTINQTLVNLLFYNSNYEEIFEKCIDLLQIFDLVLITTTIKPKIVMLERIIWRCIISHSQISSVILPFLINEEFLNKK